MKFNNFLSPLSHFVTAPGGSATLHRLPRWEALSALRASESFIIFIEKFH